MAPLCGQSVGFGPDRQPLHINTSTIDAAKAKRILQHLQVIDEAGHQFLQKDLPDLYVDLSRSGRAMRRIARRVGGAGRALRVILVSVGGAISSRGMNAQGLPWRRDSKPTTTGENADASDCGYQRAWHQHLRQLP